MYPVVLVALVMTSGCGACVITGYSEDILAEVGENATLLCPTDLHNTNCRYNKCYLRWELKINNVFKVMSSCTSVAPRYRDKFSVSSAPDWSLTITGVQPSDMKQYRCSIISHETNHLSQSPPMTLIIPSLIDISVQPPRLPIIAGENAAFNCNVQSPPGALPNLKVKWFVNGTDVRRFQDHSFYHLDNDGYSLTFFKIKVNLINVYCKAFSGTKSVKGSDNYLVLIHPQKKPITSITEVPDTKQYQPNSVGTNSFRTVPSHSTTPTKRNTPSVTVEGAHQSSSFHPFTKDPDIKIKDTLFDANITVILVGWPLAAVFICLFISILMYIIVTKTWSKANPNSNRVVQTTQHEDEEAYMEMETQLHVQAVSTGHKETAPSSYQELIFK